MLTPQQAVVPTRRERELGSRGVALATRLDHLAVRPPAENAALEEVLLPAQMRLDYLRVPPPANSCSGRASSIQEERSMNILVLKQV